MIRSFTSEKPEKKISWPGAPPIPKPLMTKTGYHRFNWDLRSAMLPAVDRVFVYGSYEGGVVPPGEYTARIQSGDTQHTVAINLLADPNIEATAQAYQDQADLLEGIENHIREIHQTVQGMREVQKQLTYYLAILEQNDTYNTLYEKGKALAKRLDTWERELIQPDQKTFQDVINFNNKLNAEFMHLKGYVDSPIPDVTQGAQERYKDLESTWKKHKSSLDALIAGEIADFNAEYKALEIPSLVVPTF